MLQLKASAAAVAAACGTLVLAHSGSAFAQAGIGLKPSQLPQVVVTGNPLGSELFDLVAPVSTLSGEGLVLTRKSTLGETIGELPGVSSSYFGPNASRPVIRGLDGDRIRILQNGLGMLDASSASPDHATAVDPLIVDRMEVVRGPAALLYGGSAVGGVVNVIDNRIPQAPLHGFTGSAEARFGGAQRERAGAAVLEGGNGGLALHVDVYARETDDLRIPGLARSDRLRASGSGFGLPGSGVEAHKRLPNSAARSHGGALGGAVTWDHGYVGVSFANFNAHYGTVGEETVRIDMKSDKVDLAGELRDLGGAVNAVKFKLAHTDYEHNELSTGNVAVGALHNLTKQLALAVNYSYTQRAPTYYELFANGPHIATLAYEVGNATFGKEKSQAVDLALRMRSGAHSAASVLSTNAFGTSSRRSAAAIRGVWTAS